MYDHIFEYFLWDYTDIAPIRPIHECLLKNPEWEMYTPVEGRLEIICTLPENIHKAIVIHFAVHSNIEDFFEDDQLVEYQELFKKIDVNPLSLNKKEYKELCKTLPGFAIFDS